MKLTDLMYLGMGAAYMAKDRLDKLADEMAEQGKMSREEAESFLEEMRARGEKERKEFEERTKEMMKEAAEELGLATKKDIQELKDMLASRG
ncbi:phasin family protein [Desulfohalovibrio reitneri]|uniref:phasin family protein n=1 Tax=Desulfohalovibrio reitneri TaxID=1307759 RepID=UPI0004A70039|nr:hypothetical protein [Desulfohalovibrio reitneri]